MPHSAGHCTIAADIHATVSPIPYVEGSRQLGGTHEWLMSCPRNVVLGTGGVPKLGGVGIAAF
jgi:hypothetical protein